ncbi:hypothetical protein Peur_035368 [Populus x canadensis]
MKLSFLDLAGISYYQALELVGEFDLVTFLVLTLSISIRSELCKRISFRSKLCDCCCDMCSLAEYLTPPAEEQTWQTKQYQRVGRQNSSGGRRASSSCRSARRGRNPCGEQERGSVLQEKGDRKFGTHAPVSWARAYRFKLIDTLNHALPSLLRHGGTKFVDKSDTTMETQWPHLQHDGVSSHIRSNMSE